VEVVKMVEKIGPLPGLKYPHPGLLPESTAGEIAPNSAPPSLPRIPKSIKFREGETNGLNQTILF